METVKNLMRLVAIALIASLGCESILHARHQEITQEEVIAPEVVAPEEIAGARIWYTGRGGWDPADRPLHQKPASQPTKNKHRKRKKRTRNCEAATTAQEIPGSRLDYRGRGGYDQHKYPHHYKQQNQAPDAEQKRSWFNWQ